MDAQEALRTVEAASHMLTEIQAGAFPDIDDRLDIAWAELQKAMQSLMRDIQLKTSDG